MRDIKISLVRELAWCPRWPLRARAALAGQRIGRRRGGVCSGLAQFGTGRARQSAATWQALREELEFTPSAALPAVLTQGANPWIGIGRFMVLQRWSMILRGEFYQALPTRRERQKIGKRKITRIILGTVTTPSEIRFLELLPQLIQAPPTARVLPRESHPLVARLPEALRGLFG